MTDNALAVLDDQALAEMSNLGMEGVDPRDIRPPSILLIHAIMLGKDHTFVDATGVAARSGQYFNTGSNEIYDSFDAYFLFAHKAKYFDANSDTEEEKYQVIGVMADTLMPFSMTFKKSSMNALTPLWTFARSMKRPLFSIKVHVESKEVTSSNNGKTWSIPVVRASIELSQSKVKELLVLAQQYGSIAKGMQTEDDDFADVTHPEPAEEIKKPMTENVDPDGVIAGIDKTKQEELKQDFIEGLEAEKATQPQVTAPEKPQVDSDDIPF